MKQRRGRARRSRDVDKRRTRREEGRKPFYDDWRVMEGVLDGEAEGEDGRQLGTSNVEGHKSV